MFSIDFFASRMRKLRKEKGVTQDKLAEYIKVTPTQISDLENGKTCTTIERLYMLADYFDVSIDYLVGRSDNPKRI